jgi:tetratricopeptide (TPR) repeat protein
MRNEIYRSVFNLGWIRANMPVNWARFIDVIAILIAVLLIGTIGFYLYQQSQRPDQAEVLIEDFRRAKNPADRLTHLAGLFKIDGYEDQARDLFHGELSQADQLDLFDLPNPQPVGQQVLIVVRGLYADPSLRNNWRGNTLLNAMADTIQPLESSPSLGAAELRLEITLWLRGRNYHQNLAEYQQAINAYNNAIKLNDQNPGLFLDRGLAYASLGESELALTDLAAVLRLDERYATRVEEALIGDGQLYTDLWNTQGENWRLIALVPTPTNTPTPTPTPTSTATPTPSPTPRPTDTPVLPTASPTPTPTSAAPLVPRSLPPTPTVTPTATAGIPTGSFALLFPSSLDDDVSYGPTKFEWEWLGPVPPQYGFEVRVWREGEYPTGAHNAVLDNQQGNITQIDQNKYGLNIDITDAAGVQEKSGIYLWTVAFVQISPEYADLGQQAAPEQLIFAKPAAPSDDGGDGSGGGVRIE